MNRLRTGHIRHGSHREQFSSSRRQDWSESNGNMRPVRFPNKSRNKACSSAEIRPSSSSSSSFQNNSILSMVAESLSKNHSSSGYQYLQPGWYKPPVDEAKYEHTLSASSSHDLMTAPPLADVHLSQNYSAADNTTLVGLQQRMTQIQQQLDCLYAEEMREMEPSQSNVLSETFHFDQATQERREKELARMERILQQQEKKREMRQCRDDLGPQVRFPSTRRTSSRSGNDGSSKRRQRETSPLCPRNEDRQSRRSSLSHHSDKNRKRRLSPAPKKRRTNEVKEQLLRRSSNSRSDFRMDKKETRALANSGRRSSERVTSRAAKRESNRATEKNPPKIIKLHGEASFRRRRALDCIATTLNSCSTSAGMPTSSEEHLTLFDESCCFDDNSQLESLMCGLQLINNSKRRFTLNEAKESYRGSSNPLRIPNINKQR